MSRAGIFSRVSFFLDRRAGGSPGVGPAAGGSIAQIERTPEPEDEFGELRHALRRHPIWGTDVLVSLLLAVAALAVRSPFISRGETLLHSDEAIVGLMAQDIGEGSRFPTYFYGQRYMGALEAYVIAALGWFLDDPITSLRLGPACFFAALVALQYLMLTRWFGRTGGLVGATTLLAASPMFVQWSVSARGGYVEILVWGTLLWWLYSEWFVAPAPGTHRSLRQAALGAVIGSGMWINPTIVVFVAPVVVHALLNRPLAGAREHPRLRLLWTLLDKSFGRVALSLPAVVLVAILVVNCLWSVHVEDARVQYALLLDVLPRPVSAAVLAAGVASGAFWLVRRSDVLSRLRHKMASAGPFILGALAGNAPAGLYVLSHVVTRQPMEYTLPLGLRPLWMVGETATYLTCGLPLLVGADPAPFLDLVRVGRSYVTVAPAAPVSIGLATLNSIVLVALATACIIFALSHRAELGRLLRLRPCYYSPAVFLLLALGALIGLYLVSGCTVDFTSVRYLVPLWAVLPGLIAAIVTSRYQSAARVVAAALIGAWVIGQCGLCMQLGPPHPLTRVAQSLAVSGVEVAVAEPLDAHLLSFLTRQNPRVAEFQSFWPRLAHYRGEIDPDAPVWYVVHAEDKDWSRDWLDAGWPGRAPPETSRFLWPALKRLLAEQPEQVLARQQLVDGYELWRLARPLPERQPDEL